MNIEAVIPARNEERYIERTLQALVRQTLRPSRIIVVNDGSTDRTAEIAAKYADVVVDLPDRGYRAAGTPILAGVINRGLREVTPEADYVLILGADDVLPNTYLEEIVRRMMADKAVMASGVVKGVWTREFAVRGVRVVNARWWRRYGLRYPIKFGWEAWLIFRALKDGLRVKVYDDLVTYPQREVASSINRYYKWGRSMKALNYWPPYALARILRTSLKSPRKALALLKGYLTPTKPVKDIQDFVSTFQRIYLGKRLFKILSLS